MNQSMDSCAQLFECSHPRLDALTALARESGAYGARLTGAGWGGCAVALVAEDKVKEFIAKMRAGYDEYKELEDEKFKEAVFATKPSSGACGELFFRRSLFRRR
jgi:galactokinase